MSVEIDWNSAESEEFKWAVFNPKTNTTLFFIERPNTVEFLDSYLYERPKSEKQSAYTQEMYDAGELPEVGMSFLVSTKENGRSKDFDGLVVEVLAVGDSDTAHFITFRHPFTGIASGYFYKQSWVKPIDQRTDKQKTDNYLEEFLSKQDRNGIFAEWSRNLLKEIISGKIPNLKYTGKDND